VALADGAGVAVRSVATVPELFERVAAAVQNKPADLNKVGGSFAFEVASDALGGGKWTLDLNTTPPALRPVIGPANVTFRLAASDLIEVTRMPDRALQLYFSGRLRIAGDPMQAVKLRDIIALLD